MNTQLDLETAKLAIDKGMSIHYSKYDDKIVIHSYPTIADVVMWLYEKYNIWISIYPHGQLENKWKYLLYKGNNDITEDTNIPYKGYNSPTEACLEIIKYTLNKLNKRIRTKKLKN